jgi:hypothetical protein
MPWTRDEMAVRAAQELRDGFYVNLGIGRPTQVANFLPSGMSIILHNENGMLGTGSLSYEGEKDADLINAGGQTVPDLLTPSFFDSAESFAIIRGGPISLSSAVRPVWRVISAWDNRPLSRNSERTRRSLYSRPPDWLVLGSASLACMRSGVLTLPSAQLCACGMRGH